MASDNIAGDGKPETDPPRPLVARFVNPEKGFKDVVKLLLAFDADVMRPDREGCTALHWAARNGHTEVCRCLIKYGAKIDAVFTLDGHDWSPITLAKKNGHADTVALLERRLTPCAHCGNTAQQSGVHEKMKVCSLCRSVHYCSKQCSHAAWVAAGGGHSKECKRLGTEKRGLAAWLAAKRRQREPKQKRTQQPTHQWRARLPRRVRVQNAMTATTHTPAPRGRTRAPKPPVRLTRHNLLPKRWRPPPAPARAAPTPAPHRRAPVGASPR